MYRCIAFLLLFDHFSLMSIKCPKECACHKEDDSTLRLTCVTNDPVGTIQSLPSTVSRLLLLLGPDVHRDQRVSFNNLPELKILMLEYDTGTPYGHSIWIENAAFSNSSKLEVFRSRVRSQWDGIDHFVYNTQLKELMLSQTTMSWYDFSSLANNSLSNKKNLSALRLRYFTVNSHEEITNHFSPITIFEPFSQITIKQLDLASNGLYFVAPEWLLVFPYLEYLDVSFNMLCYPPHGISLASELIINVLLLPGIKYLDIGHQGNFEAFTSRANIENSIVTSTAQSNPNPGDERNISPCECDPLPIPLGRLEYFGSSELFPTTFPEGITADAKYCYCFADNNLKHLDASDNKLFFGILIFWEKALWINLNELSILYLQKCRLKRLSTQFFNVLPKLQFAYLHGNMLGASMEDGEKFYFFNNSMLRVLDLANNDIRQFPTGNVFINIGGLTHLNLSDNHLSSWNTDISNLNHLISFNLSGNSFTNVADYFRDQLENASSHRKHLLEPEKVFTIDLSRNPLSCLCGYVEFVSWMQTTKVNFYNKHHYTCIHPKFNEVNLLTVDITDLTNYCFPNSWSTIVISVSVSTICTLVVVAFVTLYCKRWYLRYWWYLLNKGWHRLQDEQDETDYQFDVFVAHNTEDAEWVTGPLFDELETKRGLRLCLYQRDILPNEVLVQAIVEKISRSRRTLLVLSPNFVASNWCHFELHIAHARLCEEGKDVIVSVILKELPAVAINQTLYKLLKRKVYLEWPSEEEGQALFWDQLASALTPPVGACDL